jgi:hypothetical protein
LGLVVLLVLTDRLVWYRRLRVLEERIATQDEVIGHLSRQNTMLMDALIPPAAAVFKALHQNAAGDEST